MGQAIPVKYDFAAATQLSADLAYLGKQLTALADQREQLRSQNLDCPDALPATVPWKGKRRDSFNAEFSREQSALRSLAQQAFTIKGQVDSATEAAVQAKSKVR
jgi:septal ring factor EnvC (AmiA/AmiB activator)